MRLDNWLHKPKAKLELCIYCGAKCQWLQKGTMWLFLEGEVWHVFSKSTEGFDDV